MKKIILIEDRPERKSQFLNKNESLDWERYRSILDTVTGKEYTKLQDSLLKEAVSFEHQVIIIHRSAFKKNNGKIIDKIKAYCKSENKQLVLFSGGISTTSFTSKTLHLNSMVFYGPNLKLFLDDSLKSVKPNPLILGYGENWSLNLKLVNLEKMKLFLSQEKDFQIDYETFLEETGSKRSDEFLKEIKEESGAVNRSILVGLVQKLTKSIKEEIIFQYV